MHYRCIRLAGGQALRDRLGLGDDFIDGPDADLAPGEFDHNVTAVIETQRLPKTGGNTQPTGR